MEAQQPQPTGVTIRTTAQAQLQVLAQDEADFASEPEHLKSSTIASGDDAKQQEIQRQAWFENVIKKELKIPNSYLHVAPLIIRWASEVDDYDAGHTDEIEGLNRVFARFGFHSSTEIRLNPKVEKPQYALNCAITEHIRAHDGPNKLMIIYYTGHGMLDEKDRLLLAARRDEDDHQDGKNPAVAYWHRAETPLLDEDIEGDVLTILDCCFASDAHKGRPRGRRIYDLLAACPKGGSTPAPGETSFTRSLIRTFDRLWAADSDQRILTTTLLEEIGKTSSCQAELHDRLYKYDGHHVQLTHVNVQSKEETERDAESFNSDSNDVEEAGVKLRFSLSEKDITQAKIESWGQRLIKATQDAGLPLRRIDWLRLEGNERGRRFWKLANYVRERNGIPGDPAKYMANMPPTMDTRSSPTCRICQHRARENMVVVDSTTKATMSLAEDRFEDRISALRRGSIRGNSSWLGRFYEGVMVPMPWFVCLLMFAVSFLLSQVNQVSQRYPVFPEL